MKVLLHHALIGIGLLPYYVVTGRDCLTEVDPNTDYFPVKVEPTQSISWNIEYYNTYKVLKNLALNETYVLYQCGSEPPTIDDASDIIEVPIHYAGLDVTPLIPFFELLDVTDSIVAFTSDPSYIASPCVLESIDNGDIVVVQTSEEYNTLTADASTSQEVVNKLQDTIGFISSWNTDPAFTTDVRISETTETTNAAIFEWIKFVSVFFNLEEKANEIFTAAQNRWQCIADNASRVQADNTKPVVLWAYYSDYCEGWDVGQCPNYYCEYAEQCSVDILSSTEGVYSEKCYANYMTTEQFIEFGKDADYWVFPSYNWDETYTLYQDELNTMKSVQNQNVYDYQGSGENAWFEQRSPEYFAVLQDFCSIVGTTTSLENRNWFRNVLDGSTIGTLGECTEDSRASSLLTTFDNTCEDMTPSSLADDPVVTNPDPTADTDPTVDETTDNNSNPDDTVVDEGTDKTEDDTTTNDNTPSDNETQGNKDDGDGNDDKNPTTDEDNDEKDSGAVTMKFGGIITTFIVLMIALL